LTVVNPSPDTPREAESGVAGARIVSCATRTLTASTLDAHNSFAEPNAVAVAAVGEPDGAERGLVLTFPKASVTAVTLTLA
jgi:alpha-N-arabinofuranosidase